MSMKQHFVLKDFQQLKEHNYFLLLVAFIAIHLTWSLFESLHVFENLL